MLIRCRTVDFTDSLVNGLRVIINQGIRNIQVVLKTTGVVYLSNSNG